MFPFSLNLVIYAISMGALLVALYRHGKHMHWSGLKQRVSLLITGVVWGILLFFPISRQYQKEINITLSFKDSPYMTWWREQIITYDLSRMQKYLANNGVPVPSVLPPITVGTGKFANQVGSSTPPNLPINRGALEIGVAKLGDRQSVTFEYLSYVMQPESVRAFSAAHSMQDIGLFIMFSDGLVDYFNSSYWNQRSSPPGLYPPGEALWSIRAALGQTFADKLAAASVEVLATDSADIKGAEINIEQARILMLADSLVESECDNWPKIRDILIGLGIPKNRIASQKFEVNAASAPCIEKWGAK
jgi:hypothetical protein